MKTKSFKPLLAVKADFNLIRFPVWVTPKLDGIRCIIKDGKAVTRKLLDVPNRHIQKCLSLPELEGLDGEIIVGSATSPTVMQDTTSGTMSRDGEPDFTYYVFDDITDPLKPYKDRVSSLYERELPDYVVILPVFVADSQKKLDEYESSCVGDGFEGVMIRDPDGRYKYGRSTEREGILLKYKRFEDSEAVIIGAIEKMHNTNDAQVDELGHTKRSSAKDGMVPMDTLGALQVRDVYSGIEFEIGTGIGLTIKMREDLWKMHKSGKLCGLIVTYTFQPSGVKEKPRFPSFKGFRSNIDI